MPSSDEAMLFGYLCRLLVDDSPLTHYMKLAEQRLWSEGVIGRIYVNNAPDFEAYPEKLDRLMQLVAELESTPFSMGPNSTQLWIREFNNYRQYFADSNQGFYDTLRAFLKISFNKQWSSFLHWKPGPNGHEYVNKFYFTTAFKIPDWNVRTQLLLIWRNITSDYSEFQAMVFDENNFFSDQMLELKQTTLSSLGTAILAMILVCILFIADSAIVFWVSFMLVSMDIGVCGYLSLWGRESTSAHSDLDPTTVVNILMSIGLCIDFATHVGCRDPDERIADSLGAIGWPVVQAGVSTMLCIVVMLLVPSNVVRMFARTNILVVSTGLFHGLFLLPIIIRSFAFGVGDSVKETGEGNLKTISGVDNTQNALMNVGHSKIAKVGPVATLKLDNVKNQEKCESPKSYNQKSTNTSNGKESLERHIISNNHLSPRVHTSNHRSKRNSLTKVPSNSPCNSESQHSIQQLANGQKSFTDYDDDDTLSSLLAPRASAEADDQLSNSIGDFSDDQLLDEEPTKNEDKEYTGRYNESDYLPVIARTFARLLQHQPHLRVLWPFSRQLEGGGCALRMEHLLKSEAFRHHCQCYQASFTMIMDNIDDEPALSHILQQFGSNHFFYDCIEPHIRMMREEFFNALVDCLIGSSEELDEDIAEDWDALWSKIESNMRFGLKVQRHNYLAHCLTSNEMELLRAQWYRLAGAGSGIGQLASSIGTAGAEAIFERNYHNINSKFSLLLTQ
uniref:Globin family profile domain-containing protein n=1 Tax=Meloidogyne javanica TaxID=6303 RepID=A0A915LP55_MELJA